VVVVVILVGSDRISEMRSIAIVAPRIRAIREKNEQIGE